MISVIIFIALFYNILNIKAPIFILLVLIALLISVLNDYPEEKRVKKK